MPQIRKAHPTQDLVIPCSPDSPIRLGRNLRL